MVVGECGDRGCFHRKLCYSGSDEPVDIELPNQWLWDIIDEFIYQVWT